MNQQPGRSPISGVDAPVTTINIDGFIDGTLASGVAEGSGSAGAPDCVDGVPSNTESARDGSQSMGYCQRRRVRLDRDRMTRGGFMVTRLRNLQTRHGQWTCFFCCHVTTGTAIIGAWHVLLHLLALALLSLAVLYPNLLETTSSSRNSPGRTHGDGLVQHSDDHFMLFAGPQDVQAVNCSRMPCLLATQRGERYPHVAPDFPLAFGHLLSTHQLNSEAVTVAVFITLCTLLVTMLLLYGVARHQPQHLMPFFFLQVFDFCISSMTMVSYLSYLPNLRQLLQETPAFPFRDQLLAMQTNCLTFTVMMIFIATFMVKAYCINIVWRCYKFLLVCRAAAVTGHSTATLLAAAAAGTSPANTGGSGGGRSANGGRSSASNPGPEHCMQWLLQQDYRTKLSGAYPEPPPSYDMAMAAFLNADGTEYPVEPPQYPTQEGANPAGGSSHLTGGGTSSAAVAAVADDDSPLLPRYEDAVRGEEGAATASRAEEDARRTGTGPQLV